jgi:hypothetical protein
MIELDHGYLTIARVEGDPDELLTGYRKSLAVMNGVGRDHGLLVHASARTDAGLMLINLWPSAAGSQAAATDARRGQQIAARDLRPEQFRREHHELAHVVLF